MLAFARSSARALELLAAGAAHAAGVHLGDNARETRRALPRHGLVLAREAGLALAPGVRVRSARAAVPARLRW